MKISKMIALLLTCTLLIGCGSIVGVAEKIDQTTSGDIHQPDTEYIAGNNSYPDITICPEDPSSEEEKSTTEEHPVTDDAGTSTEPESKPGYRLDEVCTSLFTDEARQAGPVAISENIRTTMLEELEALLSQKTYSDDSKEMLRSSLNILMDYYPNYQSLFMFLDPPEVQEYIRKYFFHPLARMVDTIIYEETENIGGLASDYDHRINISKCGDPVTEASILIHELWHMAVCIEHDRSTTDYYYYFNEGSAHLAQLTLVGSKMYDKISDLSNGGLIYDDPDNPNHQLYFKGINGFSAKYSIHWFRLFSLTDFDTMALFMKADGEEQIFQNIISRYGNDGKEFVKLYKEFFKGSSFEAAVAMESKYLELFQHRLEEVNSPAEMLSYLQLYRLMRLAFSSTYEYHITENYEGKTADATHPALDYHSFDVAVMNNVIEWGILNSSHLTPEDAQALAKCIVTRPYITDTYLHMKNDQDLRDEPLLIAFSSYKKSIYPYGDVNYIYFSFKGSGFGYSRFYHRESDSVMATIF